MTALQRLTARFGLALVTALAMMSAAPIADAQQCYVNFSGRWIRSDGFNFTLSQAGCQITGAANGHVLNASVVGSVAQGTVERRDPGDCVAHIYVTMTYISPTMYHQTTTGTDGGCGLPTDLHEEFDYHRM